MFYEILEINKEKNQTDVNELEKVRENNIIIRLGRFTSKYAIIPKKYITQINFENIVNMIEEKNSKYEVILKNDLTKIYLDCELQIPQKDTDFINNLYISLNNKLKSFLNNYGVNDYKIIFLDSSREYNDGYKVSTHVIVNETTLAFKSRKTILNIVREFKEYCSDNENLYNFIDTKPYTETFQLFRLIFSKKDFEESNITVHPLVIENMLIKVIDKSYIIHNLMDFFVKIYTQKSSYTIVEDDLNSSFRVFVNTKNNTKDTNTTNKSIINNHNNNYNTQIKSIPKRIINFIDNEYSNIFIIKDNMNTKNKIDLIRKIPSECIVCDRIHDKNNAYITFNYGYLYYNCYMNINNSKIIYNIYDDIDILYEELTKKKSSSSSSSC